MSNVISPKQITMLYCWYLYRKSIRLHAFELHILNYLKRQGCGSNFVNWQGSTIAIKSPTWSDLHQNLGAWGKYVDKYQKAYIIPFTFFSDFPNNFS